MRDILIVDDSKLNLAIVKESISDTFNIFPVTSGKMALKFLEKKIPDLILLDINMPEMNGKETLKNIKKNSAWENIPIIFLTANASSETEVECLSLGADDFIPKPFVPIVMKSRIMRILELNDLRTNLEEQLSAKTKQLEKVTLNSIMVIANTVDAKDKYTSGHSVRVAKYSEEIARKIGLSEKEIQNLHYIALLHDIGVIGVHDSVLNKPSKLTEDEFEMIKKHTTIGGEILKDIHMIPGVEDGALYHHERYDGTGYPKGLKGEEIPLVARIICLADSFDAMTSDRIYRKKLPLNEVCLEIKNCLGTQFDPKIGEAFLEMLNDGFSIENENFTFEEDSLDEDNLTDKSSLLLNKIISEYTSDIKSTATTDSLTGLFNRSYMEETITELLIHETPGALFIIDMDNFKFVNDTYGHIVGDRTLKTFAATIRSCINEEDLAGRLGGDEFLIFIKNTTDPNALSLIAANIISSLSKNLLSFLPANTTSVSIGIALSPEHGTDFMNLYKNADRALYHIKENGKNSYHFFKNKKSYEDEAEDNAQKADLATVKNILQGNISKNNGAYNVGYSDFQKIYNFISRYIDRKYSIVQIVLFTVLYNPDISYRPETIDEAMDALEATIISSLRSADVTTKYSNIQHIVVLMDSNMENGKRVAERIINSFDTSYQQTGISVSYDIQSVEPQKLL